ncbi:uncharacterized protein LOC127792316 [Diospyros lotus]|uniref:uncharacterized protein LOC127792316 n=1 Tax=Diospyros lotus TaxID=55363 RepID=UPI002251F987|nr:uncharacterized protein LOC127792316 [Diospyros lotus]
MQRQYLQFDEAQGNVVAKNHGYDLSSIEAREAASGMHMNMINFTQPTTSMASSRNIEISKSTVSRPSGIGSHINTIMPTGCGATGNAISGDKGCLKMPTRLVPTMGCHQPENTRNIPTLLNNRGKFLASSEGGIHEAPASGLTSTLAPQPSQIVKASNYPGFLELGEYQRTQGDKRESMNEHADAVEESNQSGPKKKRKQATGMSDDDIWKRCNCKKTKCLKLYCDCFAAGIYCAGSCTCQDCFNNLDYEDTVLDTRQQIESRNPLAFSPKIEDANNSTPSLARHKRGCNCRKSTCVKKYCECYQANVGCSDGCRCEGCKNPYGIKEEYGVAKDVPKEGSFPEKSETQLNERMEMAAAAGQDSMLASELFNHHNLTHLTPAFQFYDSRMKDIPESRFSNSSCLPSPQSNLPLLPGERSPILPPKPDNNGMLLLKAGRGFQDSVQGLNYSNIETAMEKFSSPRYDLTTLPNHPSSSPAMAFQDSSKFVDRPATIATARSQLYPGSSHLPSGSSPYWQRPPPPTPPAATQFGERTLTQAVDLTTQDGMLKTPNYTSTPLDDEVKADSPSGSRLPDSPA